MNNNNVIRKKVELLHQFNDCQTEQDFTLLNNAVVLPLYQMVKKAIDKRCEEKDFTPVTIGVFYFSDFNYMHDAVYFLENMHYDIISNLSHQHFIENGWAAIA